MNNRKMDQMKEEKCQYLVSLMTAIGAFLSVARSISGKEKRLAHERK
jgi:hypothetical protein